jgi:membrane fusion protein, heavy metal efflux system
MKDLREVRLRTRAGAIVFAALACSTISCQRSGSGTEATSQPVQAASASQSAQAQLFTVPEGQMSHVQVVRVERSALRRALRLTGSVTYNSFETTPVITQVGGPVARVMVYPGDSVTKGEPLLDVASQDFSQARTNYLKARDALSLADTTLTRDRDLYAHNAIALADLQQAESTRNQARADLLTAQDSLKVLGISDLNAVERNVSTANIPLLAPVDGEIVERLVSPGQVVQASATQCFTISNMKSVWVLANVYQQDLAFVHRGDEVKITTDAYPGSFRGTISYIAPALDPSTRTLQVRIVTQNPSERLKKDMYVTATVQAAAIPNALTVPDAAVLRDAENEPFVYVATGSNQFAQRHVSIGESQSGRTQILSGLNGEEHVVADGSLFLQFANSLQR